MERIPSPVGRMRSSLRVPRRRVVLTPLLLPLNQGARSRGPVDDAHALDTRGRRAHLSTPVVLPVFRTCAPGGDLDQAHHAGGTDTGSVASHPGWRNSSPPVARQAHRRARTSPLRRSVTASLAGEASRGGRFPSPPAFGAFNSDFVNADPPRLRGAVGFRRIALHVLAAIVLYLALCTVLWLGLQVNPAWGTAGFVGWLGLVAAWSWWTRRRGRCERGPPPPASRPGLRHHSKLRAQGRTLKGVEPRGGQEAGPCTCRLVSDPSRWGPCREILNPRHTRTPPAESIVFRRFGRQRGPCGRRIGLRTAPSGPALRDLERASVRSSGSHGRRSDEAPNGDEPAPGGGHRLRGRRGNRARSRFQFRFRSGARGESGLRVRERSRPAPGGPPQPVATTVAVPVRTVSPFWLVVVTEKSTSRSPPSSRTASTRVAAVRVSPGHT